MESPPYVAVMLLVVVAVGVKVTLQVPPTRVQVADENTPAPPVAVNVTVPVGVLAVPGEVSVTTAVQVDG